MAMEKKQTNKKKIVLFGTGVGSLSTAFELTDYPGWEELYDITIYQLGWRAGGKTATSRGLNNRIQERGIHILQGWYWNMFRLLRRTYDERRDKKMAPGYKFQDWTDAVIKDDTTLLTTENKDGTWDSWPFIFPEDKLIPGDAGGVKTSVMLKRVLAIVCQLFFGSPYKKRGFLGFIPKWIFGMLMHSYPIDEQHPGELTPPRYGSDPVKNAEMCKEDMSVNLEDRSTINLSRFWFVIMCVVIWPVSWIYFILRIVLYPLLTFWTGLIRLFSAFEWILITTKGSLKDCYVWEKSEIIFAPINKYDYREWLSEHGGSKMMIRSGLVKFMYYGSFANLKGDAQGILAADIAVRIVLDTVFYKGSLVWKTRAGTGGTIIAPYRSRCSWHAEWNLNSSTVLRRFIIRKQIISRRSR